MTNEQDLVTAAAHEREAAKYEELARLARAVLRKMEDRGRAFADAEVMDEVVQDSTAAGPRTRGRWSI